MRVITWNINSVRLRINSVKRAVKKLDPDVLCLQETKCLKEDFPFQDFENMGFVSTETYGIKGYNGCLLYTSPSPRDKRQSRMPSSA